MIGVSLSTSLGRTASAEPYPGFDWYAADDASGSGGASSADAVAALSSLTLANGDAVGIKAGNSAVGKQSISGLTGVTLGVYGTGSPEVPAGFNWSSPGFTVGYESTTADFSDPVSVTKTYYVDIATGNDANAGTTGAPLATIAAAIAKSDVDRIAVKAGDYWDGDALPANGRTPANRNCSFVVWGTGRVRLLGGPKPSTLTWTDQGSGAYSTTITSCHLVVDGSLTDDEGYMPKPLTKRADLAAVQAAAEGYFVSGTTVYVKCGRAPDANLWCFTNRQGLVNYYSNKTYIKDFDIFGFGICSLIQRSGTPAGANLHIFDNCRFGYSSGNACSATNTTSPTSDVVILLRDCIAAYAAADNFNWDGTRSYVLEETCRSYNSGWNGTLDAANQCSTGHNTCKIIRVNGDYYKAAGQNIADTGATHSWNVLVRAHDTRSSGPSRATDIDTGATAGTTVWLDCCLCYGSGTSLAVQTGAAINYRGLLHGGGLSNSPTEY